MSLIIWENCMFIEVVYVYAENYDNEMFPKNLKYCIILQRFFDTYRKQKSKKTTSPYLFSPLHQCTAISSILACISQTPYSLHIQPEFLNF